MKRERCQHKGCGLTRAAAEPYLGWTEEDGGFCGTHANGRLLVSERKEQERKALAREKRKSRPTAAARREAEARASSDLLARTGCVVLDVRAEKDPESKAARLRALCRRRG